MEQETRKKKKKGAKGKKQKKKKGRRVRRVRRASSLSSTGTRDGELHLRRTNELTLSEEGVDQSSWVRSPGKVATVGLPDDERMRYDLLHGVGEDEPDLLPPLHYFSEPVAGR